MSSVFRNTPIFCSAIVSVFYGYNVAAVTSGVTKKDLKKIQRQKLFPHDTANVLKMKIHSRIDFLEAKGKILSWKIILKKSIE